MKKKTNVPLSAAELAQCLAENPHCILCIDRNFDLLYKNKAVDALLKDCGLQRKEFMKILPHDIKKQIRVVLQTNKVKSNLEADLDHKIYCYTLAPIKGKCHVHIYGVDITKRKQNEYQLNMSQTAMKQQKHELERKNMALSAVISHVQREKEKIRAVILKDMRESIMPIIQKIKNVCEPTHYIELLEKTLNQQTILETRETILEDTNIKLSPRERAICNLIKNNMSSKDIAEVSNISVKTVEKHRRNIRAKFHIQNKKVNLISYLRQRHPCIE